MILWHAAVWLLIVGSAAMGGIFFAFSVFVISGLSRLAPERAIAAMQAINLAVITPWFLGVFLMTAAVAAAVVVAVIVCPALPGSRWVLVAALLYGVGIFLVTVVGNVPLNDALAAQVPDGQHAQERWDAFARSWLVWNHARTAAGLFAMVCAVLGFTRT